jgi:hypothetical protein
MPHIGGKVSNAPPMNKWLIPIQVVARTFDETMVPISDHTYLSRWNKYVNANEPHEP